MLGEYDSGYENYIDSLIREIEKLQDENDKLREQVSSLVGRSFRTADKMSCIEAENAKLREDLEFERSENGWAREFLNRMGQKCGTKDCPSLVAYVTKLEADNAKLRELVRDLWEACPVDGYYCIYHCEHYDKESESHCKLEDRMRELGVDE